ncbi:phosphotransferase family protein [Streptomyces sp. NBC_01016]|uniref:phosphotransferase family protein n=1 Tax=Streptomyces sp. NBC_01016 TaxID=2903720 RepID=UPI00224F6E78|nr:phosphotransferase family protein [Streptomyces sp. NBC_01016]MCX4831229.1 phosphotransferase family protein [Streptomyces sp. NBC_01016]
MSEAPVFAKGRDLDAAAHALRPWLAARLGVDDVRAENLVYPRGAGVSNETILFDARASGHSYALVLRVAPAPEHQMFMDPRFRLQYDMLVALRRLGTVRVPEALWYEADPALLGRPFYVMRRMRGRVPVSMPVYNATGWLTEATPGERHTLWEGAVRQLATVHGAPTEDFAFLHAPDQGAPGDEQQLTYWRRFADWALEDEIPDTVHELFGWVTATQPPASTAGLSWGDARIGNMMFDEGYGVVGVMDWEQSSLAGPMADLGWWLLFDDIHSVEQNIPRLDGLGTRGETLDLWQELTGRPVEHLHWHEVFAGLKAGLLALHTRRSMKLPAAGRPNPFIERSRRLLGWPSPGSDRAAGTVEVS